MTTRTNPIKQHHSFVITCLGRLTRSVLLFCLITTSAIGFDRVNRSDWVTAAPEEVGVDSTALVEMFDYIRQHSVPIHSVQIIRGGRLILDAYFYPYNPTMRHDVASVTKSITSTLTGLAIEKKYLRGVDQSVMAFFPDRSMAALDARKRKLAIEDLLTMQSGWDCGVDLSDPRINVDERLAAMRQSTDWLQYILDLPMATEPGTHFAYCNANCHLLSIILSRSTGRNELAFARQELFGPLGIRDVRWPADSKGNSYGWSDLQLHPLDMAKFVHLLLQHGRWNDMQIIPEAWIKAATQAHVNRTGGRDHYGYLWWIPGENLPGVFEAVGRGGQRITTATPPPKPKPIAKLPLIAALISGKTFRLSANTVGLSALTLEFNDSAEVRTKLQWNGHTVHGLLGLDGVERFSNNPLVGLPQAGTGQWLSESTFLLKLDLVGAINCYYIKLNFLKNGKAVNVDLSERTGLNKEQFTGTVFR